MGRLKSLHFVYSGQIRNRSCICNFWRSVSFCRCSFCRFGLRTEQLVLLRPLGSEKAMQWTVNNHWIAACVALCNNKSRQYTHRDGMLTIGSASLCMYAWSQVSTLRGYVYKVYAISFLLPPIVKYGGKRRKTVGPLNRSIK